METVIKLQPSELNDELLRKIREFIGTKENIDVTITLTDVDQEYATRLRQSIDEAVEKDNLITFTMEEFSAYRPGKKE
jgi:hypothetical protein